MACRFKLNTLIYKTKTKKFKVFQEDPVGVIHQLEGIKKSLLEVLLGKIIHCDELGVSFKMTHFKQESCCTEILVQLIHLTRSCLVRSPIALIPFLGFAHGQRSLRMLH